MHRPRSLQVRRRVLQERAEWEARRSAARKSLEASQEGKYYANNRPKEHMPIVYKG